jgi:hypothetical protein
MKSILHQLQRQLEALQAEGPPKKLHVHPCVHCPSIHSPDDPESVEIRDYATRAEKIESVFRCAWRREKACRGYADFIGVTENDLALDPTNTGSCP